MAQLITSNSLRVGTNAHAYATTASNNAITMTNAGNLQIAAMASLRLWVPVKEFNQDWSMLDGRPTDDNNPIAAVGNARPVTLPEFWIGCAIYWFRHNYPTVLEDKHKVRFSSLYQDSESIRKFYNNVKKYGKMLKLAQSSVEEQFFKGMAPDTQLEADRIRTERPLGDLVDSLEKVEKKG